MGPSPGIDVDDTGREADLCRELREPQRGRRRLRIRLQDEGAAGSERRRELPRRHQQRVVPGHDLTGDADGLLQRVGEDRAADRIRAAADRAERGSVEAEVLGGAEELGLHRGARLAHVARLELDQLLAVRDDRVRERVQEARALARGRLPPGPVEGGARRSDGAVDLGLAGQLGDAERLAACGLDELAGARALDRLAVDVEPELPCGRDAHDSDDIESTSATRTCRVRSSPKRPGSPATCARTSAPPYEYVEA